MLRQHCSQARFLALVVIALMALAGRAGAQATATLTVSGSEQQISGTWDSGNITVAFDNFSETIHYSQFSAPAAIASALAGLFSRDFIGQGLCAHASGAVVKFQLRAGGFGALRLTEPTTSFQLSGSGFGASSIYDSGTVTLTVTVNGQNETAASTTYGQNSTPVSVTAGLAANIASGSPITVEAVNDAVYVESSTPGSTTDYQFTLQATSNDPSVFTTPSFESTSGQLEGGADASSNSRAAIYGYGLAYDPVGNVESVVDSVMGTWTFSYDTLDRLTGGQQTTGPTDTHAPSVPFANYCWSYDGFGNRTAAVGSANAFSSGSDCTSTPLTYNANNHVSGGTSVPSYDPSGNVTTDNNGDGNVYLYDAEGRICAVKSGTVDGINIMTGYVYDAEGRRVAKGTITSWSCDPSTNGLNASLNETDFVLDQGGHQVTELANDANGAMTWAHTNVWAGGQLLGTYDATTDSTGQQDGALHFYLSDWLGSRRAQADYAGVWEQDCSSLPYGDQLNCTQSTTQPTEHHFTGKERDTESGNDYFGARYYASSMGRFLSPDWASNPGLFPTESTPIHKRLICTTTCGITR